MNNFTLRSYNIQPPGRLISNMLSSLERYCPNKEEGCEWTGKSDQVKGHVKTCNKKSRSSIAREMEEKDILIALLKGKISASNQKCAKLESEKNSLKSENEKLLKKLQVYDAFFNHNDNKMNDDDENDDDICDAFGRQRVADDKLKQKKSHQGGSQSRRVGGGDGGGSSDAANLAKLRNYEKKSVYL